MAVRAADDDEAVLAVDVAAVVAAEDAAEDVDVTLVDTEDDEDEDDCRWGHTAAYGDMGSLTSVGITTCLYFSLSVLMTCGGHTFFMRPVTSNRLYSAREQTHKHIQQSTGKYTHSESVGSEMRDE